MGRFFCLAAASSSPFHAGDLPRNHQAEKGGRRLGAGAGRGGMRQSGMLWPPAFPCASLEDWPQAANPSFCELRDKTKEPSPCLRSGFG